MSVILSDVFAVRSHTNAQNAQDNNLLTDVIPYSVPGVGTVAKARVKICLYV